MGGGTEEAKKPSHTWHPILAEPMRRELENSREGKGFFCLRGTRGPVQQGASRCVQAKGDAGVPGSEVCSGGEGTIESSFGSWERGDRDNKGRGRDRWTG